MFPLLGLACTFVSLWIVVAVAAIAAVGIAVVVVVAAAAAAVAVDQCLRESCSETLSRRCGRRSGSLTAMEPGRSRWKI